MHKNQNEQAFKDTSDGLGFTGRTLDPQAEKRNETSLPDALSNPDAVFLLFLQNKIILKPESNGTHRALFSRAEIVSLQGDTAFDGNNQVILLGDADGISYLAFELSIDPATLPELYLASEYRALYTQNLLPADIAGMVAQASALLAWHTNHRFCGRCGNLTEMRIGGFKRQCTSCEAEHFPRTDPVVIMLVIHRSEAGEHCLLARGAHFAPLTYSCLAGFIEPGETVENAVRREVREESGISVGSVTYHASQPWPFPYSLMIGCIAYALNNDLALDHNELEDGRWFSREEAKIMLNDTHPKGLRTPPAGAIASALIKYWVENA